MSNEVLRSLNGTKSEKQRENDSQFSQEKEIAFVKSHHHKMPLKKSEKLFRSVLGPKENTEYFHQKERSKNLTKSHKVKIFDETRQIQKKYKSIGTQTEREDGKILVCSEKPTEKYWELLAEERRKALVETLEQNEQLAADIEAKKSLIEDMKQQIEQLEEVASHTHYLASVVEDMMQHNRVESANETAEEVETLRGSSEVVAAENVSGDGNNVFHIPSLSDGSCSHDSDKENKPPVEFLPLCDNSD